MHTGDSATHTDRPRQDEERSLMFLLNEPRLRAYMKANLLSIDPLSEELLHPTWYYFRLGRATTVFDPQSGDRTDRFLEDEGDTLAIPANGYARIWSQESFRFSERVLGMFGHLSDLVKKGLALVHSPSIDPHFNGYLEMGLQNLLPREQVVRFGDPIGKLLFFDISDSNPIPTIDQVRTLEKLRKRATLDAVRDQLIDPTSEW